MSGFPGGVTGRALREVQQETLALPYHWRGKWASHKYTQTQHKGRAIMYYPSRDQALGRTRSRLEPTPPPISGLGVVPHDDNNNDTYMTP